MLDAWQDWHDYLAGDYAVGAWIAGLILAGWLVWDVAATVRREL